MSSSPSRIRCRPIGEADIGGIINLLARGFPFPRERWVRAFQRLARHRPPCGFPQYGYLLESGGVPVGVLPTIFASIVVNGEAKIRCNVSSWYVDPEFRSHAAMLASHALKHKDVTYLVITPFPHTIPILEAQGYTQYCRGRFVAVPALSMSSCGARVEAATPDLHPDDDLPPDQLELLREHVEYGCISLICTAEGRRYPMIFLPRRKFACLPFVSLVYCRALEDFVRFAGSVGRFLACRGYPLVIVDANGPIPELVGTYSDKYPKYFKGPEQPRIGDLAYSKRVFFDV